MRKFEFGIVFFTILFGIVSSNIRMTLPGCRGLPGTPGWNNCFTTFQAQVNSQQKNHHTNELEGVMYQMQSSQNGVQIQQSNGFEVKSTGGIPVSLTSSIERGTKVTLNIRPDSLEKFVNGRVLELWMYERGTAKNVFVTVPFWLRADRLEMERLKDKIHIYAPARW